jgi:hypothetical protein
LAPSRIPSANGPSSEPPQPGDALLPALHTLLADLPTFARYAGGVTLRSYQAAVARAVVPAILRPSGLSFVVLFPRQSGKNELQAQLEAYLLLLLSAQDAELVKVSPTWKPQSLNAMRRLERALRRNPLLRERWSKESGYIYRVGAARIAFFSAAPEAHIVGATASTLLEVDEAQDVLIAKYDRDIAPMAASTNATRLFWGTAWTADTLLARELRAARALEGQDGQRRAFTLSAEQVGAEVPAYRAFVASEVARLGREHPMVRTQYFSEELDASGGMFPPARQALMRGSHPAQDAPRRGGRYALLIDVAGEDEAARLRPGDALENPARDATAATVVEVLPPPAAELPGGPLYHVVARKLWLGTAHSTLFGELAALARLWDARAVVIDATGVGAGLASFLERALPGRVLPFVFNAASKSKLGWDFLALVDSGRFQDYAVPEGTTGALDELFWRQVAACEYAALPGPQKALRWSVPDGRRDPASGELLHDDLLLSAALCAALDAQAGQRLGPGLPAEPLIVRAADPLRARDHGF